MAEHGLSDHDVAEDGQEVVDVKHDDTREWLAVVAARLHRCAVLISEKRGICIRGRADLVKSATLMYEQMIRAVSNVVTAPVAPWLEAKAREVWKVWWWESFSTTLRERFPESTAAADQQPEEQLASVESAAGLPEPPKRSATQNPFEPPVDLFRQYVGELRLFIDIFWFQREARSSGRRAAQTINLPNDVTKPARADRSLPEKPESRWSRLEVEE